ncbi:LytTR family transcriptional regulator DNA-binding domain-containing protein [Muricauda sp. 2012CJ35-5]|uniref:LytTR family transcriptional regulator DNA-binding domain-containing protein n=1 Tax=Flagellimonas spongiicola TaxID=2942208 RepID=A0ABT0PPQ2_9FLAO|nr:LytTR family transcriptional regulator DNA-binding domain-containing protein [Allomuricauda spongiicola]MCL6273364.1 LytTR family transcriptional regulator DNA-binding domain-containing protein [Allomuricauda spongiicola]
MTALNKPISSKIVIAVYGTALLIAVLLQLSHYVFYYGQNVGRSFVWSLVDWSIWFLIFTLIFQIKNNHQGFISKIPRGLELTICCFSVPILHVLISNLSFLVIFEPSRPFIDDVLHQLSKKWFQNLYITIGLYFLFDYVYGTFLKSNTKTPTEARKKKLVVKDGKSKYQLNPAEIEWVESAKNYLTISMINGEQIVVRNTLQSVFDSLKEYDFIRVSRSTIINISVIYAVKKRSKYSYSVQTKSNKTFPIGKTFVKSTLSQIQH